MKSFKIFISFLLIVLYTSLSSQNNSLNFEQIAHIPVDSFQVSTNNWGSPNELSDIWGWVDEEGNEYAIVGTNQGTAIFDLSNPSNPQEIFFEQGMNSIWRDIKTFGDYAYVTTEAQNGLLIIDMSSLPGSNDLTTYYYTGSSPNDWQSAHNLYVDERGYAYIFGANRGEGGCIILDLNQNPTEPVEVADIDNWYVHDGMVKDDTLYLAHISDGFFSIWDVSSPSNPIFLSQHGSLGSFCHNVWVSDDGDYLYTTDEITNGFIGEYNIEELDNIYLSDKIQTDPGSNVIPHNTHFLDNYIITSYYRSGVVVHDVSQRGNMVEIGSFDTSPNYYGDGFNGCWGVYPWLPSGLIIASDIEGGLFVLSPEYIRGAYLEGNVIDAETNQPISGVNVEIIQVEEASSTNNLGEFKMGTVNAGTYNILFSHPTYQNDTLFDIIIQNDSTTTISHSMFLKEPISVTVETKKSLNNTALSEVNIILENEYFTYTGITNLDGYLIIDALVPGEYEIYAGMWGYEEFCDETLSITSANQVIQINLDQGYSDRFNLDMNWEVNSTAFSGIWVRDNPTLTTFNGSACNPGDDSFDCGNKAYVTGNLGENANADDVDFGYTELISPNITLSNNESYFIHCSIWWKNLGIGIPDDSLFIMVNDGINEVILFTATSQNTFEWRDTVLQIPEEIDLSNFNVKIITADGSTALEHLVEAGLDNFLISNSPTSNNFNENTLENIVPFPNPTKDGLVNLKGFSNSMKYEIYSITGQLYDVGNKKSFKLKEKGVFILVLSDNDQKIVKKIIY